MFDARAGDRLLADLLDGGILVTTPAGRDARGSGGPDLAIATLLQPDGDVVTLVAGSGGGHGAAALARHAAALRRTTREVRRAARRLRRRSRFAAFAAAALMGTAVAGGAVAISRAPGASSAGSPVWLGPAGQALAWEWLAGAAAIAGGAGVLAGLAPLLGRAALRGARSRRIAAANRAWLADHGFHSGAAGISSRARQRRA